MAATCHERADCLVTCLCGIFSAALFIAFIVYLVLLNVNAPADMRYYISVDSVSGLDLPPSKDLALDPQFNLTVRLESSRHGRPACMGAGTYLVVSYHCVPLATSASAPEPICVEAKNSSMSMLVVAKGTGVRLPGYMMDSLVADLRSGVQAFNVQFSMYGVQDMASCGFRRVGDVATECGFWNICPRRQDKPTPVPPLIY
ncbi:hypothetical protein QYE76_023410 [Lolium multiflorum]|uniref:Uncharacterized protein n=1 Tax=Lolium multiflorum TaxID=4521 RepID=A0AAD8REM6_LOLMU|nr:hypothetical protein QYE76_023410 [Lolium multiflorum]